MFIYGVKKSNADKMWNYPLKTLMGHKDDENGEYDKIVSYYEQLSDADLAEYDLEFLGTDNPMECESCKINF